jgi:hypothetical protein
LYIDTADQKRERQNGHNRGHEYDFHSLGYGVNIGFIYIVIVGGGGSKI